MRSFTDIFIKHPVLAIVVNLMIVLAGWRALTTLPLQQYPKIESSSVIITRCITAQAQRPSVGFSVRRSSGSSRRSAGSIMWNPPAGPV